MGLPKMPPQVVRLVALTALIVGGYVVARHILTPPSFGDYGWYRGAALTEVANSRPPLYAGTKECEECHAEEYQKLLKHDHKTLSCEGCHGAGAAHADNPDVVKMEILNFSHCVRCHEYSPSRPKGHHQIILKAHNPGQKCTECHVPHMPQEVP
jgi:hypothetical protein